MSKYITMKEYLRLLEKAIPEEYFKVSYRNSLEWHPEDLGCAVEFANEVLSRVLGAIDGVDKTSTATTHDDSVR